MISAQQGVEFTTDSNDPVKYGNIKKVYSIWLCTKSAQTRANSIEVYSIDKSFLFGSNSDDTRYDILNAIIIYISKNHDHENAENEMIRMLTYLFDKRITGAEKVMKLKSVYGLKMTREVESEVKGLCTYADAIENEGIKKGIDSENKRGLKALVKSLKVYVKDFDELYIAVTNNENYENASRETVMKYYNETTVSS
jgi:hypothetical protein